MCSSAVILCAAVVVASIAAVLTIAAVPEKFRALTAGAFAATALLLAMAQVPILYRSYPVSEMPDVVARGVRGGHPGTGRRRARGRRRSAAVAAFEDDDVVLPPVG